MGIRKRIERILKESRVRPPLAKGMRRYEVPAFNGFRRFFNKANKKSLSSTSVLASLIMKETMMGHSGLIQLDKNYFKSHIDELIEEYVKAVPNLTISKALQLEAENNRLREEKTELEIANERAEQDNIEKRQLEEQIKNLEQRQGKLESDNRGYGDLKSTVDEYLKEYFEDVFDKMEFTKNKQQNSITS